MPECGDVFASRSEFLDGELTEQQMREFEGAYLWLRPLCIVCGVRSPRKPCRRLEVDSAAAGPVREDLMSQIRDMYRQFKTSASDRTE